eukprot:388696_1
MFLTVVTVLLFFDVAYSAVQGTVQSTNSYYCGDSISGSIQNGYANAHVWIFQTWDDKVDVIFSTCNSPDDFSDGLVLYDYNGGDGSQSQVLGECYFDTGIGCDTCGHPSSLTDWTVYNVGGGYELFYIEIYSVSSGTNSYRLDITCTPTAPSNSPTAITDGPTLA